MRMSSETTQYRQVQGLARGMKVLTALNASPGSTATVAELSERVKLHRTTVKRLLETLRLLGFVRYLRASNAYGVTFRIRQLSDSFRDEIWISEVASPALRALTEKIAWPSDLMTLDGDAMVVRETTHPIAPLSFSTGAIGDHIPMLWGAAGRAYLSFCPEDERVVLLKLLRLRQDEEGTRARDAKFVAKIIETTQARGYATNDDVHKFDGRRFASLAIPIRRNGRVLACINIIYLLKAIRTRDVIERFLPDLVATGREIEAKAALAGAAGGSDRTRSVASE